MIYDRKSNFEMQYCKNVVNFLLPLYTILRNIFYRFNR